MEPPVGERVDHLGELRWAHGLTPSPWPGVGSVGPAKALGQRVVQWSQAMVVFDHESKTRCWLDLELGGEFFGQSGRWGEVVEGVGSPESKVMGHPCQRQLIRFGKVGHVQMQIEAPVDVVAIHDGLRPEVVVVAPKDGVDQRVGPDELHRQKLARRPDYAEQLPYSGIQDKGGAQPESRPKMPKSRSWTGASSGMCIAGANMSEPSRRSRLANARSSPI